MTRCVYWEINQWRKFNERRGFHKIWIGYCHRHCLKRFHEVLEEYQKLVNCSRARISELYLKFKKILKTSTSKANMEAKIRCLDDEAFGDPLLQARLTELRENASHYTAYKNRKGITANDIFG